MKLVLRCTTCRSTAAWRPQSLVSDRHAVAQCRFGIGIELPLLGLELRSPFEKGMHFSNGLRSCRPCNDTQMPIPNRHDGAGPVPIQTEIQANACTACMIPCGSRP